VVHLRQLHQTYGEQVEFLFVHIHSGPHELPEELQRLLNRSDAPEDLEIKHRWCIRESMNYYQLPFICLLDTEESKVEALYEAFPRRLVLVDRAGRVALDSGRNPSEAMPWEEITVWLEKQRPPVEHHAAGDDSKPPAS
jgi:hypothetical protein